MNGFSLEQAIKAMQGIGAVALQLPAVAAMVNAAVQAEA